MENVKVPHIKTRLTKPPALKSASKEERHPANSKPRGSSKPKKSKAITSVKQTLSDAGEKIKSTLVRYRINKQESEIEGVMATTYGIEVVSVVSGKVVLTVNHAFSSLAMAEEFIKLIELNNVESVHFFDVLMDFLE